MAVVPHVTANRRAFVAGHPVAHSRSPMIHAHWLEAFGIAGSYERVDVAPDAFPDFLRSLSERGYVGGNVTLPHKEAAFRLVDEPTEAARRLGAVNTVWLGPDGRLAGHNTDGQGFAASLDEQAGPGWERDVATALVLGAGGAARAVVAALLDRGLAEIVVGNRTETRAQDLVELDPGRVRAVAWSQVETALGDVGLLVNTTQLGMTGQPPLDLDLAALPDAAIVADIVYVPLETPLLAAARRRGLRVVDGLGMLLHQAVPGFAAWFGRMPVVDATLRALVEADLGRAP